MKDNASESRRVPVKTDKKVGSHNGIWNKRELDKTGKEKESQRERGRKRKRL